MDHHDILTPTCLIWEDFSFVFTASNMFDYFRCWIIFPRWYNFPHGSQWCTIAWLAKLRGIFCEAYNFYIVALNDRSHINCYSPAPYLWCCDYLPLKQCTVWESHQRIIGDEASHAIHKRGRYSFSNMLSIHFALRKNALRDKMCFSIMQWRVMKV